jgi:hypothetical protein
MLCCLNSFKVVTCPRYTHDISSITLQQKVTRIRPDDVGAQVTEPHLPSIFHMLGTFALLKMEEEKFGTFQQDVALSQYRNVVCGKFSMRLPKHWN